MSSGQKIEWKVVAGFPEYDINNAGNIRQRITGTLVSVYAGVVQLGAQRIRSDVLYRHAFPHKDKPNEIWKTCMNQPAYAVSSLGNVRNVKSGKRMTRHKRQGYEIVALRTQEQRVHRLVAEAFIGPAPSTTVEREGIRTLETLKLVVHKIGAKRKRERERE